MVTKLSAYISDSVDPHRNLAIEEYLTFHVEPGECILYLWQNKHTVVIGKNQNAWKECNVHKLEEDGGHLVRRLSGGGAVYHDLGNLNFTFCVKEEDYNLERQLDVILRAVRRLGIDAVKNGRNDITAVGRKFSGNAFYKSKGCCYHHGTLLVNVDQSQMQRYLNVSSEKLKSKGVNSVRSRTINLSELNPKITIEQLKDSLLRSFSEVYFNEVSKSISSPIESEQGLFADTITDKRLDWDEIGSIQERMASSKWKYGRKIPFEHSMSKRFPWGELEVILQINSGIIHDVVVYSDAIEQDISEQMIKNLSGCPYNLEEMVKRLDMMSLDSEQELQIKQDIRLLLEHQLKG